MHTCLFCSFVTGEKPCHRIWEDKDHLAFLTIFPNTPGFTVVIPKRHYPSYVFDMPAAALTALIAASRAVVRLLDRAFDDVGRTALVFEGFSIDHVHAKLIPLHGSRQEEWRPILSDAQPFSERYEGFITTHDGPRADDAWLAQLAERIRNA